MKSSRKTTSYLFWLILLSVVAALGSVVAYVNAYFTATASKSGEINFHKIGLEINTNNANNTLFSADVGYVLPGDTITLDHVSVKNSGSADVYALVNFDIRIARAGYTDYVVNHWYNLAGGGCYIEDLSANTTEATELIKGDSQNLSLSYHFDRHTFDNTFKKAKATITLKAVGIQTANLESVEGITSKPLIAAYMLLEEFHVPHSTNAVDYSVFETQSVINCPTPDEKIPGENLGMDSSTEFRLYNFSIANVSANDNMYVYVTGADLLCIMPGNHELQTFLMNYMQEIYPPGAVMAQGQGVANFTLTGGETCEFAVVTQGSINTPPTVKIYTEPSGDLPGVKNGLAYYLLEDKSGYSVKCADANLTNAVIENTFNGLPVKEIADGGFYNQTKLRTLTIGSNVETIGSAAFAGCTSLGEVEIPNSVEMIERNAFYGCTLSKVTLNAKEGCLWVTKDDPPKVALVIAQLELSESFSHGISWEQCKGFVENGLAYMLRYGGEDYMVWAVDKTITSASIRSEIDGLPVTTLPYEAFKDCTSLKEITIPSSVTNIYGHAFQNCTSLTKFTLQAKEGYKWQVVVDGYDYKDCSTLTDAQILEYAKAGGIFRQIAK